MVSRVMENSGHCCFKTPVRVYVDRGGEGAELFFKFILELLHSLRETPFGYYWVRVGHVVHCLDFVRDGLSSGYVGKADCRIVGNRAINTSSVWDEIDTSPDYGCRLV